MQSRPQMQNLLVRPSTSTYSHAISLPSVTFLVLFSLVSLVIFFYNKTGYLASDLSFLLNLLYVILGLGLLLSSSKKSLLTSVYLVFFYTFFWLAPLLQTKTLRYPNTMSFDETLVVRTNLLFLFFGVCFFFFRYVLARRSRSMYTFRDLNYWPGRTTALFYVMVSLILLLLFYRSLISSLTMRQSGLNLLRSESLILSKFLYSIPLFLVYYVILDDRIQKSKYRWVLLLAALLVAFIFKNPLNEKRNAVGPIYLSFLFVFFRSRFKTNLVYVLLLLLILSIAFPIAQAFTHNKTVVVSDLFQTLESAIERFDIRRSFTSLDYDSWSMAMATIEYVDIFGTTYGRQLAGAFLFFVPRSIWQNKPVGSGHLVATEYLMVQLTMWFTNLSNSFPSEGYINFGLIGVLLFALMLAILSMITDEFEKHNDLRIVFAVYTSFHMVFMLRGDLMSSFAYLVGALIAIFFIPLLLAKSRVNMASWERRVRWKN